MRVRLAVNSTYGKVYQDISNTCSFGIPISMSALTPGGCLRVEFAAWRFLLESEEVGERRIRVGVFG